MFAELQKHKISIAFAFLAISAAVVWRVALARTDKLIVDVFNVGQGDAIFVELPDQTQILIDGGPDASVLRELADVMPLGDHSIDLVVATHSDADHVAGLIDVLDSYNVKNIVETGILKDTQVSRDWEERGAGEGANIIYADAPKRLRFGDEAELDLLWPTESHRGETSQKPNDYGITTLFTYGEKHFLFTADIERWTEDKLLSLGALPDVDVLKVAHHGSKTSTSEAFLDATKPEMAAISVGKGNSYGHPHQVILDRLAHRGIPVYRTDQDGRVEFLSDGKTIEVRRH